MALNRLFLGLILCVFSIGLSGCTPDSSYSGSDPYDSSGDNQESEITSDNWECTDDCSGHEAGYSWAEDKGITDPDDCGGKSESFIEGCEAWANEQ